MENDERRIAGPPEIREVDGVTTIGGYAAVFDQWSQDLGGFIERIQPGFFAGVLADEAVNPYIILRPILPVGAPDLGCGKPLPLNLNDVTRTEPQG